MMTVRCELYACFFFNDTATTEIYTLSLHDALPISGDELESYCREVIRSDFEHPGEDDVFRKVAGDLQGKAGEEEVRTDRKSTRLNSSHANISYAVFCLKKKNICYNRPNCLYT